MTSHLSPNFREIERLEHRALDWRPWREWGHTGACEDCRWEAEKDHARRLLTEDPRGASS